MNSNVNVVKESGPDKNLPEWPTKRYGAGQQVGAARPSTLEIVIGAPWQSLGIIFAFLLILALLVWRWRVVWCYEQVAQCAEQSDRFWGVYVPVALFVIPAGAAAYVAAILWTEYQRRRAVALQGRIVFDRFTNPVDVEVFTEPKLLERTKAAVAALAQAGALEAEIAPSKIYSGVNVLTTSASNVATNLDLPPKLESPAAPAGVPSRDWLRWIDETPHLMIAGRTNAGKTTLASAILAERIQGGDEILVIDPHDQPDKWFGVQAVGGGRQYGAILSTLERVVEEMDARYQEYNNGTPTAAFTRLTVLVDEVPAIMDACLNEKRRIIDARWSNFARQLGSEARKVRISVILLTQSALVQDIGVNTAMRKNFSRIALDDEVHQLLSEERDSERRKELDDLIRGQKHAAVMEWRREIHVLNTSDVPDLAAQSVRGMVRAWVPSVWTQHTPTNGRSPIPQTDRQTDGKMDPTRKQALIYALRHHYKLSRDEARQRLAAIGEGLDNDDWAAAA